MGSALLEVTITRLALDDPSELRPPRRPPAVAYELERADDPLTSGWFYRQIGDEFGWTDRRAWPDSAWRRRAARIETWVISVDGERAGYFDLEPDRESVQIVNFGLLTRYRGVGLGGHGVTRAIERGFELRPRVWVSTNTLDGEHALANYLARGMRPFSRRTEMRRRG